MRCHEEVWSLPESVGSCEWLNLEDIQCSTGDLSSVESSSEFIFINSGSSADVHEHSGLLHLGESVLVVEEVVSLDHFWECADYVISFCQNSVVLVKSHDFVNPFCLRFGDKLGEFVDADRPHTEGILSHFGDSRSNVTVADDSKSLISNKFNWLDLPVLALLLSLEALDFLGVVQHAQQNVLGEHR